MRHLLAYMLTHLAKKTQVDQKFCGPNILPGATLAAPTREPPMPILFPNGQNASDLTWELATPVTTPHHWFADTDAMHRGLQPNGEPLPPLRQLPAWNDLPRRQTLPITQYIKSGARLTAATVMDTARIMANIVTAPVFFGALAMAKVANDGYLLHIEANRIDSRPETAQTLLKMSNLFGAVLTLCLVIGLTPYAPHPAVLMAVFVGFAILDCLSSVGAILVTAGKFDAWGL